MIRSTSSPVPTGTGSLFSQRVGGKCAAPGLAVKARCVPITAAGAAMRLSEFDKIGAALDRAEFALEELRRKSDELYRKREMAKTLEEIAALNLEVAEILQQLRKIRVQTLLLFLTWRPLFRWISYQGSSLRSKERGWKKSLFTNVKV